MYDFFLWKGIKEEEMNEQIRHIETLHIYIICLREHLNPIGTRGSPGLDPKS